MEMNFEFLKQPTQRLLGDVQHLVTRGVRSGILSKAIKRIKLQGRPCRLSRKAANILDKRILKFLDTNPAIIQKLEDTFNQELPQLAEYWQWAVPFVANSLEYHYGGWVPLHVFVDTEEEIQRRVDQAELIAEENAIIKETRERITKIISDGHHQ